MSKITEETIKSGDATLYTRSWMPESKTPVATITFVHGLGEHCGRYDELFSRFASENGIIVNSFDHRGHGKSSGPRGHIPSTQAAFSDMNLIAKKASPSLPHFMYGHSMGGGLVLGWGLDQKTQANPIPVRGYVTTAPFINIPKPPSGFLFAIVRFLSKLFPSLAIGNGLPLQNLSRDQKYKNDPLVHGKISVTQAVNGFTNGANILKEAPKFDQPLLLMVGDNDVCICPKSCEQFFEKCGSSDKTLHVLPGHFHELHNEPKEDRENVIRTIQDWLLNHLDATPSEEKETVLVSTKEEAIHVRDSDSDDSD